MGRSNKSEDNHYLGSSVTTSQVDSARERQSNKAIETKQEQEKTQQQEAVKNQNLGLGR